jgi:hypothetical protein
MEKLLKYRFYYKEGGYSDILVEHPINLHEEAERHIKEYNICKTFIGKFHLLSK